MEQEQKLMCGGVSYLLSSFSCFFNDFPYLLLAIPTYNGSLELWLWKLGVFLRNKGESEDVDDQKAHV